MAAGFPDNYTQLWGHTLAGDVLDADTVYPSGVTAESPLEEMFQFTLESAGDSSTASVYGFLKETGGAINPAILADVGLGDYITTAAYWENSDLGAATYRVVAAATGTDDGGSFLDAGSFQLEAVFGGEVSVGQFGAVGDGVTDDTVPLQTAIDFACNGHLTLRLPSGTLLVSSTLTVWDAVSIVGAGTVAGHWPGNQGTFHGSSKITANHSGVILEVGGTADTATSDSGTSNYCEGVRLESFVVEHATTYGVGTGILVDGSYQDVANRGLARDIRFTDVACVRLDNGLVIKGNVFDFRADNCAFTSEGGLAYSTVSTPGESVGLATGAPSQLQFFSCLFWQYQDGLTNWAIDAVNSTFWGGHIQSEMGAISRACSFFGVHHEAHTKSLLGSGTTAVNAIGNDTQIIGPTSMQGLDRLLVLGDGISGDSNGHLLMAGSVACDEAAIVLSAGTGGRKVDARIGQISNVSGGSPVFLSDERNSTTISSIEAFSTDRHRYASSSVTDEVISAGVLSDDGFSRFKVKANGVTEWGDAGGVNHTISLSQIGWHGATPVGRGSAIPDATDAADVITRLNSLLSHLRLRGDIAT